MAAPRQYYHHGLGPFAYEWQGMPRPPSRASASTSLGATGSNVILGLGGTLAVVMLLVWMGRQR